MKKSKRRLLAGVGAVLGCLVVGSFAFGQTRVVDVAVDDIRPLAAAILKIEELSGIPINYEDVPVYYSGDLQDVTDAVARTPLPAGQRIIAPHRKHFSVPIPVDAATGNLNDTQAVREALLRLISEYNSENLPGGFDLELSNGVFFVRPVRYRDATGATRPMTPVLSVPISLADQPRNPYQTWRLILTQVSKAAGVRVGEGMGLVAGGGPVGRNAIGAQNEPAGHVIARLLGPSGEAANTPGDVSWDSGLSYRLLFDATLKEYFLNVHAVANSRARKAPAPYKYSPPPVTGPPPYHR